MTRHIIISTLLNQLTVAAGRQANVDDLIWRRGSKGLRRSRFLALRVRWPGAPRAARPPPVLTGLGRNCLALAAGFWQISGKRRFPGPGTHNRPGAGPGLSYGIVVEPPAGIELAAPSLPWN